MGLQTHVTDSAFNTKSNEASRPPPTGDRALLGCAGCPFLLLVGAWDVDNQPR
nr:hypothetical protein [Kibdelosporangium sp. MJ126-NF4]